MEVGAHGHCHSLREGLDDHKPWPMLGWHTQHTTEHRKAPLLLQCILSPQPSLSPYKCDDQLLSCLLSHDCLHCSYLVKEAQANPNPALHQSLQRQRVILLQQFSKVGRSDPPWSPQRASDGHQVTAVSTGAPAPHHSHPKTTLIV